LLIFFSVLGGLDVFGVLGIVLGPVTVALTLALFDVVRQANAREDAAELMPVIEQSRDGATMVISERTLVEK
jgi:predicted PurR-regulated permease PerM